MAKTPITGYALYLVDGGDLEGGVGHLRGVWTDPEQLLGVVRDELDNWDRLEIVPTHYHET